MDLLLPIGTGLIILIVGGYFAFKKMKNFASNAKEQFGYGMSEMTDKLNKTKDDPRFKDMTDEERKGIKDLQDLLNGGK